MVPYAIVVDGGTWRCESIRYVAVPKQRRTQLAVGAQRDRGDPAVGRCAAAWRGVSARLTEQDAAAARRRLEPGFKAQAVAACRTVAAKGRCRQRDELIGAIKGHAGIGAGKSSALAER